MILQNYRLGFGVIAIAFHQKETNREFEFENQLLQMRVREGGVVGWLWLTTMASPRPYKSVSFI